MRTRRSCSWPRTNRRPAGRHAALLRRGRPHARLRGAAALAGVGPALPHLPPSPRWTAWPAASIDAWMPAATPGPPCAGCSRKCRCCCTRSGERGAARSGLLPVNSFWASGAGALPAGVPAAHARRPAWRTRCTTPRCCRTGRPGRRLAADRCARVRAPLLQALDMPAARRAHAVRRTPRPHLAQRQGRLAAAHRARLVAARAPPTCWRPYEDHSARRAAARRLGARTGRHPSAAGPPVRRPRRERQGRTGRRPGPPAAAGHAEGRAEAAACWPMPSPPPQALCIVADYDCDGATACAVGLRGLRLLGATHVDYLVPDRVVDGYGLTPPIAQRVKASGADLLVTVDNGIASLDGVAAAQRARPAGAGDRPPPARPEVLPEARRDRQPEPAGLRLREQVDRRRRRDVLRAAGAARRAARARRVHERNQPKLDALLPLVALGTVADVVKLDANNRRLVAQGLKRIRAGALPCGLARCSPPPAARPRWPRPSTSASRSARASTRPAGWPT
jgi:hypothetical protein